MGNLHHTSFILFVAGVTLALPQQLLPAFPRYIPTAQVYQYLQSSVVSPWSHSQPTPASKGESFGPKEHGVKSSPVNRSVPVTVNAGVYRASPTPSYRDENSLYFTSPANATSQEDRIRQEAPPLLRELRPTIEKGVMQLCLNLSRTINRIDLQNTLLAPLSVVAIVALLLAGSEGQTKKELEKFFGIEKVSHKAEEVHRVLGLLYTELNRTHEKETNLAFGSGLFVEESQPLNPQYVRFAKEAYFSEVIPVDFKRAPTNTTTLINNWVSTRTEGNIQNILKDSVDPGTSIIVVNVLYFRAAWQQPFVDKFTKMQKFHVSRTEAVSMPLMVGLLKVPFSKVLGSHIIVGLPYKNEEAIMYFILPEGDLKSFVRGLTPEALSDYINRTVVQQTIVAIPRMRIEGEVELSGPLTALGTGSIFRPSAELSGMGAPGYFVSEMLHKVSLEVTEEGTVGAAATAATILRDGSAPLFRADRPFLCFIYHQYTGSILFWATVARPIPLIKNSNQR